MGVYIMNTLMVKTIAYKLDYHWYFLKKYEKQMQQLYEKGVGLSDGKMLSLNEKLNYHCVRAIKLDRLFLAATSPHSYDLSA